MNLLHVIHTSDPSSGGPIEGIKQFYKNFKIHKINPEILCSDNPKKSYTRDKNLPKIHALGPTKFKYGYNTKLKNWLNNNLIKYNYVIVHGIWQYHSYAVWQVARSKNIPYYVFLHGMLDPWFKHKYPIKHIKKMIYWNLIEYKVLQDAKSVLYTTIQEKNLAKNSFQPYKVKEKVVGYGVGGNPYKFSRQNNLFFKKYPKLKNKKIILYFGRIHEKKGIDLLIRAFNQQLNKNSNFHLVIAGPFEEKYYDFLNKNFLSNSRLNNHSITWTGPLYKKVKWDLLNSCYFLCLPSHQENFGISIVEAMSCKKPVLITNKVNIFKDINKYKAGLICNINFNQISSNLNKMMTMNNVEFKKMCNNAYLCYKENFNSKNTSKKLIKFIKKKN